MANPLLDALGTVGHWADTPGAYTRGLLAGRPGERASGQELLSSYGLSHEGDPYGGLKGFAAEAVLDPLSLVGPAMGVFKGIRGLTRGAQALSHADDANPLLKAAGHLVGDEGGWMKNPLNTGDFLTSKFGDIHGPQWSDDLDKLRAILGPHDPKVSWGPLFDLRSMAKHALPEDLPYLRKLTSEMPDTTSVLGSGAESAVFKASDMGQDWAIGAGPQTSSFAPEFSPQPMIPEMLQPFRTASASGPGGEVMIKHSPLVTPLNAGRGIEYDDMLNLTHQPPYNTGPHDIHAALKQAFMGMERAFDVPGDELADRIRRLYPGANPWDLHPSNIAMTREGNVLALDAGAIAHDISQRPFRYHAWDPSFNQMTPAIAQELARRGTPEKVRELMMQGLASGTVGQGVAPPSGWLDRLERALNTYRTEAAPYSPGYPIESDVLKLMGR